MLVCILKGFSVKIQKRKSGRGVARLAMVRKEVLKVSVPLHSSLQISVLMEIFFMKTVGDDTNLFEIVQRLATGTWKWVN